MYIDKLDDIVNKYNNGYHSTIKVKPNDVKSSTYIDFNKENNKEGPKFKVDDHVRISKCKNIVAIIFVPDWSEEDFVTKNLKTLCRGHMLLVILMESELLEHFMKRNCKKQIKKSL